jgi:hypothetical protein
MVDSLIREVVLKHKEVAVILTPPLPGLGFLSAELARKEEKRNVNELIIYLAYDLAAYSGEGSPGATRVGTELSGREYMLKQGEPSAQTVRASAPALQTAGAVCATAQAL